MGICGSGRANCQSVLSMEMSLSMKVELNVVKAVSQHYPG